MITYQKLTIKNFLSSGNIVQTINLNDINLTLILGENLDQSTNGSRNGTGKTTGIQGICFALYGQALTNIKKDNLVNNINNKDMVVTLEFTKDNKKYLIERGRKPNFLRFSVNDEIVNAPDTDEAHGENKHTQEEIEKVIGMSYTLFKYIVALHTKTIPFLSLGSNPQREIIEELISITQLSEKAEKLKNTIKQVKEELKSEEVRIHTLISSNERVQKAIDELHFKSKSWERHHLEKVKTITIDLDKMMHIDIDAEINDQRKLVKWNELNIALSNLNKQYSVLNREKLSNTTILERVEKELLAAETHHCPTCGQETHDDLHDQLLGKLAVEYEIITEKIDINSAELDKLTSKIELLSTEFDEIGNKPTVIYGGLEEALNHKNKVEKLKSDLVREESAINPYFDQIANLSESGLQEVSYDYLNELNLLKEHQDFLLKLLVNKDSFIRKKIIDQNLNYLNFKLNDHLTKLQLPHEVVFQSDLSVDITKLGKDYDFEQLSNGEANRLNIALTLGFRDVWEMMNQKMNLLIIDEIADSGMDEAGTEAALEVIKNLTREHGKDVILISHKGELISRVNRIVLAQKENDFTTYIEDYEPMVG